MHGILDLNLFGTNSSTSPTNDIKRNKAISSLGYSTRTIEVHADLNLYSFDINKQIVFLDAKTLKIIGKSAAQAGQRFAVAGFATPEFPLSNESGNKLTRLLTS